MSRQSKAKCHLTGIVLHRRDYQESHRIIEFLSVERGRLFLIARGARVSRKRFAGILEQFVQLKIIAVPGRELWTLSEASSLSLRPKLRSNLEALNRANHVVQWCRFLCSEHDPVPAIYRFVNHALKLLEQGELARYVGVYPRFLVEVGIMPDLTLCGECGKLVQVGERGALTVGKGFLCQQCCPVNSILSVCALRVLRGERCVDPVVAQEVEAAMSGWLEEEIGRPLRVLRL